VDVRELYLTPWREAEKGETKPLMVHLVEGWHKEGLGKAEVDRRLAEWKAKQTQAKKVVGRGRRNPDRDGRPATGGPGQGKARP
jgi:hypothetical protein